MTGSLLLTCLVPVGLLALRYYYSRKVILAYLDCALHTDMADIEQYYMKPPGELGFAAPLHPCFCFYFGQSCSPLPCHGQARWA